MEILKPKLMLIAERARRDSAYRFTCLTHLPGVGFLKECYFELGRDRASGVDGISWKEYGIGLETRLETLVCRMKAKQYKPLPVKRVYIPKDEHSQRARFGMIGFAEYVKRYSLPRPQIMHNFYTLSFVT